MVMVGRGYQSVAGFSLEPLSVKSGYPTTVIQAVDLGSEAERAGLKPKDKITKINGVDIFKYADLREYFAGWPPGEKKLDLVVARTATDGTTTEIPIGPIYPKSIGLNPTQIYETISMVLLLSSCCLIIPSRNTTARSWSSFMLVHATTSRRRSDYLLSYFLEGRLAADYADGACRSA